MATEQEYDDIIVPMLAEVAQRCDDLGMSLIARVEWSPDEAGITQIGIGDEAGIGQKLAQLAVHCRGNFDSLYISAAKRFDMSQTMVGSVLQRES